MKPTQKVQAAGAGGAASVLVVFILTELGVDVPPEAAAAIATLLALAGGWIKTERKPSTP